MSKTVKVPDGVYDRLQRESLERDVAMGAIIEGWMQDADKLERIVRNWEEHFE